jgi:hypothetical protein
MTGFNKKHLNEGVLIKKFNENGIKGIEDYIGKSDSLVTESRKVSKILDIFFHEDCETKKVLEIKKIIDKQYGD